MSQQVASVVRGNGKNMTYAADANKISNTSRCTAELHLTRHTNLLLLLQQMPSVSDRFFPSPL
jgi:hypothetical protein